MILPPVYTIIGFLISIEDKFPKLINYRILSCAFTCAVGLICTVPLTSEIGSNLLTVWKYCGFTVLVSSLLLIVNLAIFFVYTTDQVINDYTFTYSHPPERYWTTLWKCCPLFSLFAFLLALTFQTGTDTSSNYASFVMMASYVHAALMLSPILVMAVIKFCTHVQNRRLGDLIQPSPEWGPRDEATNLARKNYYPRRNVRFRVNKLICQHKCLAVHQEAYLKEKENQRRKLDIFFKSS
nr:sodium-dependent neutral amino acid transporter B(0)AT2-like [Onthophagus taurus]